MKKLTTLTAVLCIMLFATAALAAQKQEFAVANDSTDDTVTGLMTLKLKEVLEAKSKGAMKVNAFTNSQLGSDREITQSLQNGELAFVVQT
uniref:hypothetical protein n=1 Tax=Cloacibacillus evryensis TaxID=508460 RepID=UPI003F656304